LGKKRGGLLWLGKEEEKTSDLRKKKIEKKDVRYRNKLGKGVSNDRGGVQPQCSYGEDLNKIHKSNKSRKEKKKNSQHGRVLSFFQVRDGRRAPKGGKKKRGVLVDKRGGKLEGPHIEP